MTRKSAGILMYKKADGKLEVLLVHPGGPFWKNKDDGAWSIPKGEFESEEPLSAAIREVHEELGILVSGDFMELSPVKQKSGKIIHSFAIEKDIDARNIRSNSFELEWPPHSGKMIDVPEVDRAEYFIMEDAEKKIIPGQLPILRELTARLSAFIMLCIALLSITACSSQNITHQTSSGDNGLKDHFSGRFTVGVAVSAAALRTDEAGLIKNEFNSMTAENAMKMGPIHPQKDVYNWAGADSIAQFARLNNMKLRGHALVWHQQTPGWLFRTEGRQQVSKQELMDRLKEHIHSVVSRYRGTVYAWDVVNEAISDDNKEFYRNSEFYKVCGEEYIERAFEFAHEADPDALLFYNDYNEIDPAKRARIVALIKRLIDRKVPIHGIGLQGHWAIGEPRRGQLDSTLRDFAELGLRIHITELDISVYQKEHSARERRSADVDTLYTAKREQAQTEQYKMCFELFSKYDSVIESVTFWNISDRHSWLDNFPVRGRKDYPLLFDRELRRKKAYYAVVN